MQVSERDLNTIGQAFRPSETTERPLTVLPPEETAARSSKTMMLVSSAMSIHFPVLARPVTAKPASIVAFPLKKTEVSLQCANFYHIQPNLLSLQSNAC